MTPVSVYFLMLLIPSFETAKFRCDYSYISNEGWFKLHSIPVDHNTAKRICLKENSELVTPLTKLMIRAVLSLIGNFTVAGIHTDALEKMKIEPLTEKDVDIPTMDKKNAVWILTRTGTIESIPALAQFHFICHKKAAEELNMCGTADHEYTLDQRTGNCYKLHRDSNIWSRALKICTSEGGNLAVINSETEAQVIKGFFADDPTFSNFTFVGLISLRGQDWKTVHGHPMLMCGYEKWALGEPMNAINNELCGTVNGDGLLYYNMCDLKMPFICEKKIQNCYDKYTVDSRTGNCYKLHPRKPFKRAERSCTLDGGHLAVINSETEAQVIRDVFKMYHSDLIPKYSIGDFAFIGLYRRYYGEDWANLDGTHMLSLSGYDKWAPGQPDSTNGDENCMAVSRQGLLYDYPCSKMLSFICEKHFHQWQDCNWHYGHKIDGRTGHCYNFNLRHNNWSAAQRVCKYDGGNLMVINSETEAQIVRYLFNLKENINQNLAFIGTTRDKYAWDWKTADGQHLYKLGYNNWDIGEPNNAKGDEYCVAVTRKASLIDFSCDLELPYICEKEEEDCNEYKLDNRTGNCYKFHRHSNTWSRAFEICTNEGGNLAVINSETEAQVIKDLFKRNPIGLISAYDSYKNMAFLGIKRDEYGRDWRTVDGDYLSLSGYDEWAPREPNSAIGYEYCVIVSRNGLLYDEPCDRNFAFICEKQNDDCL